MTAVLNAPVAPHGAAEFLDIQPQTAQVIADLDRLLAVAKATRRGHPDRLQPLPLPESGQVRRGRELEIRPRLLASMPRLRRHVFLGPGKVPLELLVNVLDDRPVQSLMVPLQG